MLKINIKEKHKSDEKTENLNRFARIISAPFFKKIRYIYYIIYTWQKRRRKKNDGWLLSVIELLIYILFLAFITEKVLVVIHPDPDFNMFIFDYLFRLCFAYIMFNYILPNGYTPFKDGPMTKKILEEFSTETPEERLKGTIFIWAIVCGITYLLKIYCDDSLFIVVVWLVLIGFLCFLEID